MCLAEQLQTEGAGSLSMSTLKRLWGYVSGYETVYVSSLNVLSRYVGCRDWDDFCATSTAGDTSDFPLGDVVVVSTLTHGDRVEVCWKPDRRIVVSYMGQNMFCVEESHNSKLSVGDTFSCGGMVNGERLVLTQLRYGQENQVRSYVCGKRDGIRARKL